MDELILKIVLAVIFGVEREMRTWIAMRTMMLICLGATLYTIYSDFSPPVKGIRAALPRSEFWERA